MTAKVKVLIEGYSNHVGVGWRASPSTVLIENEGKKILVDPGANPKKLLDALKKENLTPQDIDLVFVTHYHLDHILACSLFFPKKDVCDGDIIYRNDMEISLDKKNPIPNIEIIETPGHAHEHVALLVHTDEGIVAVAGDLWWWNSSEEQKTDKKSLLNKIDPFMKNKKALKESRKKILAKADWIIPGHGKMFKAPKTKVK